MAGKGADPKTATRQRIQRTEAYAEKVRRMFAATANEILALNSGASAPGKGVMFSFDSQPARVRSEVERLLRRLSSSVTLAIQKGIRLEWKKANSECDDMVEAIFGKRLMKNPRIKAYLRHNDDAMQRFIERADGGMGLSQRVWKTAAQLRDEMEVAMTVAIGEGESAADMSRRVRQYLNDPDLMFRRFRYKDEDGEWRLKWKKRVIDPVTGRYRFIDYDRDSYIPKGAGGSSRGVYKSAAKNAMRVTRTETNMAYRRADGERWRQMDFVLGQRIQLSGNHPAYDICNDLAGDYPVDFVFEGWHPQCFCFVTPILCSEEEIAAAGKAIMDDEEYTPKGKRVTDYPEGFKEWVTDNADKIAAARERGTEPYFIRHNWDITRRIMSGESLSEPTIQEKAAIRHAARTEEQRQAIISKWEARGKDPKVIAANRHAARTQQQEQGVRDAWAERKHKNEVILKGAKNIVKVAQDMPEVDYSKLQQYIDSENTKAMKEEAKAVAQQILAMKKQEAALADIIPEVHNWHKLYSLADLQAVHSAVAAKLTSLSSLDKQQQIDKLTNIEIKFFTENWVSKSTGVSAQTKYPTWKVAVAAYTKKVAELQDEIDWESINNTMSQLSAFKTKSPIFTSLLTDASIAIASSDKAKAQTLLADALSKKTALEAAAAKRAAKKNSGASVTQIDFDDSTRTKARKNAAEWFKNDQDANDFYFDHTNTRSEWKTASAAEKKGLHQYTAGSAYITEPLRAIKGHYHYYTQRMAESKQDTDAMTSIIARCYCTRDVWIKRDEGAWCTEYRWGLPNLDAYRKNPSALVGMTGVDESFVSCGNNKSTYFGSKPVILNIYCPAQTRMIYAEPFSQFGSYHDDGSYKPGKSWNGDTKPTTTNENEIILQRGTKFRITKAEYTSGQWYIDCEVISQHARPIDSFQLGAGGFYCKFK